MADLIKNDYPCSMGDLYSVMQTAWGNNEVHLARFTTFKALYTLPFKTAALARIAVAKALPDDDARSGNSEILRIGLVEMGKASMQNFQFLKAYIDTAYPNVAVRKIQYVMAGQNYYRGAGQSDWESMTSMNTSAKNYLAQAANVAVLTAGDNMPPAFVATLTTASDAFDVQYNNFKLAEETSVETADKIKANNVIFRDGMAMLNDAQKIFMNEPEILTKFVFQHLLSLINPAVAGIKGTVKDAGTNAGIGNASIVSQREGDVAETVAVDVDGGFGTQLKEGHYIIKVTATGYVEQVVDMELKLTGLKTLNLLLERTV